MQCNVPNACCIPYLQVALDNGEMY